MKYNRLDIMYAVNCPYSHDSEPSAPDFQVIKHLICYLSRFPHYPNMYPYGLYGTTTRDLFQDIYPGNFHSQKIPNGLVASVDVVEGLSPN